MKKRRRPGVFPGACFVPINNKTESCGLSRGCAAVVNHRRSWSSSSRQPPVTYTKDANKVSQRSSNLDSPFQLSATPPVVACDFRSESGCSDCRTLDRRSFSQQGSSVSKGDLAYPLHVKMFPSVSGNPLPSKAATTTQLPMRLAANGYSKHLDKRQQANWQKPTINYVESSRYQAVEPPAPNRYVRYRQNENSSNPTSQVYMQSPELSNYQPSKPERRERQVRKKDAGAPMCCSRLEPERGEFNRKNLNEFEHHQRMRLVNTLPYRGSNSGINQRLVEPVPPPVNQQPSSFQKQRSHEEKSFKSQVTKPALKRRAQPLTYQTQPEAKLQHQPMSRNYVSSKRGYDVDIRLQQQNHQAPINCTCKSSKSPEMKSYGIPVSTPALANPPYAPQQLAEVSKGPTLPSNEKTKEFRPDSEGTRNQMHVMESRREIDERRRIEGSKELTENTKKPSNILTSCYAPSKGRRRKSKKGRRKKSSRRKRGKSRSRKR